MKVKEMIEMLKLADEDSRVMLEIRDWKQNNIGYLEVGSDWSEYGGYDPDELDYWESLNKPRSKVMVELTLNIDEWEKLGIGQEYEVIIEEEE